MVDCYLVFKNQGYQYYFSYMFFSFFRFWKIKKLIFVFKIFKKNSNIYPKNCENYSKEILEKQTSIKKKKLKNNEIITKQKIIII